MPNRSIIYIDGFNLYYGALKDGPHKWLDLERFFTRLRQDDDIQRIFYFTARVDGDAGRRQDAYLRAIATLPLISVGPRIRSRAYPRNQLEDDGKTQRHVSRVYALGASHEQQ